MKFQWRKYLKRKEKQAIQNFTFALATLCIDAWKNRSIKIKSKCAFYLQTNNTKLDVKKLWLSVKLWLPNWNFYLKKKRKKKSILHLGMKFGRYVLEPLLEFCRFTVSSASDNIVNYCQLNVLKFSGVQNDFFDLPQG